MDVKDKKDNKDTSKSVRIYTSEGSIHKLDTHSEFCGDEVPTSLCIRHDALNLAVG